MINPRYHREIPQRYRLEAGKCASCGHLCFPPRIICPECKGTSFENVRLNEVGTLITFTILHVAAEKFSKETPFAVGIVELNGKVRMTAQIVDADLNGLKIGQRIKLVFRKIQEDGKSGILCYGYKAVVI